MISHQPNEPSPEAKRAYEAGTDLLREGAYYQASKRLLRAVSLDDGYVLAHARLAEAWTELDYADRAKDALLRVELQAAEREALSPVDALYLDAIRATVTRNFPRAVKNYQEIARQLPDRAEVYVDLGRAYEKTEEIRKQLNNISKATNRDPKNATAYLRLGILYSRQQNLASASVAFDKAEAIYKSSATAKARPKCTTGAATFCAPSVNSTKRGSSCNRLSKWRRRRATSRSASTRCCS
jgi:tetratricopeptide (TPR) repeat protein